MVTTELDEKPRIITLRNSRRNEILAISFLAVGLLLLLCLVSAAFYPSDPSWNSVGQTETRNWAGAIGANVASALFQTIGVAAFLLPLLFLWGAWRRFRTRSLHAPLNRLLGLVILVLSASALLSISQLPPLFDASVQPGGMVGTFIARTLAGGLNTVGAIVLLVAFAATGLLLATNISFVGLYEGVVNAIGNRFAFLHTAPARFKAWREARSEQARLRREKKLALQAEQKAARNALRASQSLTPAERVAHFMRQPEVPTVTTSEMRAEPEAPKASLGPIGEPARAAAAAAGLPGATVVEDRSGRRSIFPTGGRVGVADAEVDVEEMIKGASVLRTKVE
ncbi:MAG: DNA translocase FtsK 4TM domain-containing protein, partial [Pyrinomonadaceae bacterium]